MRDWTDAAQIDSHPEDVERRGRFVTMTALAVRWVALILAVLATCAEEARAEDARADAGVDASGASGPTVVKIELRKEASAGKVPADLAFPIVTTTSAMVDEALRDAIEGDLRRRVAALRKKAKGLPQCNEGPARAHPGASSCEMDIACTVTRAKGRGVSVACDGYEGLGGAHPTKVAFAYNFVFEGGSARAITLDDLVVDAAAKRRLLTRAARAVAAQLEALVGPAARDLVDVGALARSRNVAFNVVRDGGLAITFDEFPFVIGPRTVTLKARDVAGLVDPELMAAFE